jgi:hypothetical protein
VGESVLLDQLLVLKLWTLQQLAQPEGPDFMKDKLRGFHEEQGKRWEEGKRRKGEFPIPPIQRYELRQYYHTSTLWLRTVKRGRTTYRYMVIKRRSSRQKRAYPSVALIDTRNAAGAPAEWVIATFQDRLGNVYEEIVHQPTILQFPQPLWFQDLLKGAHCCRYSPQRLVRPSKPLIAKQEGKL